MRTHTQTPLPIDYRGQHILATRMSSHTTQHGGHQYYSSDTGVKCAPPVFGGEKSYARWRTELEAWLLVTNVDKKKQAITVALSFPEGSEVRDRIFSQVEINYLNSEDGMAKLLEYLDKWYKKDKLTGAYDSWTDFDSFRKSDHTKMELYISEFEKRHKKLLEYGIVLPNSVLAFKLLDGAKVSQGVKRQTLDTLDFSKPDAMFQQVVAVLEKIFENKPVVSSNKPVASLSGAQSNSSVSPGITIKSEPLYGANKINAISQWTNERNEGGSSVQRSNKNVLNGKESQRNNLGDSSHNSAKGYVCKFLSIDVLVAGREGLLPLVA